MTTDRAKLLIKELGRLYEDCNYSSQTYFEAAKSAEFWGKSLVFVPALLAAGAALLVALGQPKQWGAVGALSGAVAATASFLGSDRRAGALRDSARKFTTLRHAVRLERSIADSSTDAADLERTVRSLREQYAAIISTNELVSSRFFTRAQKRIASGILNYDTDTAAP